MPTLPIKKITAWSYSRFTTWRECPLRAKLKFIDKRPEPQGDAASRGDTIHKLADSYVKNPKFALPEELKLFKQEFVVARKANAIGDLSLTYRKDWSKTVWNDWNGAWLRIKVDMLVPPSKKKKNVEIVDFKTGKIKDDYTEQTELYAIGGFLEYPEVDIVRTGLWFLDHGVMVGADAEKPTGIYKRAELPKLIKLWEKKVFPMLNATAFPPTPGIQCRWCSFAKSKGGECKFG